MKFILAAVFVACSIFAVTAEDPAWSDLRGSFLIGKDEGFAQFPRTIREELFSTENWASTGNDCSNGGKFSGNQYVKNNDYSVGLLYDVNGVIAGIQMLIPHDVVLSENNTLKYGEVPMYANATYNNEEYFVLTAYFVDPSTICSTGRSDDALTTGGTGSGLWIQNGDSVLEVPQTRPEGEDAVSTGWTQNNCFPAMGYHNFYKMNEYEPQECTKMQPIFGLYNRDLELHGFGFITPGTIINPRFEQPPATAIKLILGNTPQCVLDIEEKIGVSSLHVYFAPRPWFITCPIFRAVGAYVSSARNWISSLG